MKDLTLDEIHRKVHLLNQSMKHRTITVRAYEICMDIAKLRDPEEVAPAIGLMIEQCKEADSKDYAHLDHLRGMLLRMEGGSDV